MKSKLIKPFFLTSTAKILYFSYRLIINHIRYDVRIFG